MDKLLFHGGHEGADDRDRRMAAEENPYYLLETMETDKNKISQSESLEATRVAGAQIS